MKQKLPIPMLIIGALGGLMMILGMVFTLTGTSAGEMSLVNILFGAFTTAAGFMLVRRTTVSYTHLTLPTKRIV